MTSRLKSEWYQEDLARAVEGIDLSMLDGASIMVSGATGMIGACLVDALLARADAGGFSCKVIALGRDEARARTRLPYFGDPRFCFEELDVSVPGARPATPADVVVHLASTTHPRAYATQPIGTISSNVTGLQNLLEHAGKVEGSHFVFASSVEVYGENRGDVDSFAEDYCGYLDCNTLRAGYPEAKRLGEALCQAYASERGQTIYVPRLPRTFGPTVLPSDTKAISQFIARAVAGQDVVLKSEGTQTYSYLYVADVVRGLLWILTHGLSTRAYNLAHPSMDAALRDLARHLANSAGTEVVFELPDEVERAGYSTATRATMDGSALAKTGWEPRYTLSEALARTVTILKGEARA
ncbi:MAG: NAD-dependent epimerase/dehydratase family protein [Atopobiaceae bacterium]|nr:NAD-dependent epimerase/dehydratase family protein [Atopobiaceae bacterium]